MLVVSNSKISTWRRCHRAYHYKYNENLRPRKKAGALRRGSIIHECIEAYDSGRSWRKVLNSFAKEFYRTTFSEEIVEIGDIPKMAEELMENYQALYDGDGLEYLGSEVHFQLPLLPGQVEVEGYFDAIVRDEQGRVWCKETKTYKRNPDYDFLVMNTQSSLYLWAMLQLGYKSQGTLWDIVRAKQPSVPQFTATGKLSQRAIDSTPYTVKKWMVQNGLDPKDYPDLMSKLRFEDYFTRHLVRINPKIADGIITDFQDSAMQILRCGKTYKDRNLSKECAWCDYKLLCQAELQGLDVSFIREKQFEVSEGGRNNGKEKSQKAKHK